MAFCTTSSFLYHANIDTDTNAYITMGRGLFQGKILYVDLFDHKGPLLYFLYGLSTLLFSGSYIGSYILESLFFTVTLFYSYLIAQKFLKKEFSYLLMFLFIVLVVNFKLFSLGGTAEEILLAFMITSLYYCINILEGNYAKKNFYILGLCIASMILIKFTLCMFLFPFLILVFFHILKHQKIKNTLKLIGIAFGGFFTIFVPFMIYFLATNSFSAFLEAYIRFNSLYAHLEFNIAGLRIFILSLSTVIQNNFWEFILSLYGCFYFLFHEKHKSFGFSILSSFLLLLFVVYSSGRIYSYFLAFAPYFLLGIIAIIKTLNIKKLDSNILIPLCITLCLIAIHVNGNYYSRTSKLAYASDDALSNLIFDLKKDEEATILEYNCLDLGIYNRLNKIPNVKFFYLPNVTVDQYKKVFDEQDRYLKEKKTKYVILKYGFSRINLEKNTFENMEKVTENYELYKFYDDLSKGNRFYVFKLKEKAPKSI